ncbi:hypothetical protein Ahy_A03g016124 [Arachis hypogaea]|uniref:Uncharacterized protein n=1 Tax=Arachis hypogaea TaxID=3818 RepID=A0A445E2C3_ARAHY|nr:hypothetical protein Ahy_A03g016124 [Arachis hypogaea]
MSGYSSAVKLEIENFDGRINFGLWQIQVKDVLIQSVTNKIPFPSLVKRKMALNNCDEFNKPKCN